jgi:hypothetical protein
MRSLTRRELLIGSGVAASAALVAPGFGAVGLRRAAATTSSGYPGELGANLFGADSLGTPQQISVVNPGFESGGSGWAFPAHGEVRVGAGRMGSAAAVIEVPSSATPTFLRITQDFDLPPAGTILRFRAWRRTEAVVDGAGAYTSIPFFDASGTKVRGVQTQPVAGTTDWTQLELYCEVPVGAVTARLTLLFIGHGTAVFDDIELTAYIDSPAGHSSTATATPTTTPITQGLLGMGVQANPFGFGITGAFSASDAAEVSARVETLAPQWVRVFTDRRWWVTATGNDFSAPEVAALVTDLQTFDDVGARANLVMWRPLGDWTEQKNREFADDMVALILWLRSQGLHNIAAVTLYNEANRTFPGTPAQYAAFCHVMRDALLCAHLHDVELVGGDVGSGGAGFYTDILPTVGTVAGMMSVHQYTPYPTSLKMSLLTLMQRREEANGAGVDDVFNWEANLSGGVGAMSPYYPGTDGAGVLLPERYATALKLAAYYLQCFAVGIKGVSYWEMFDMLYPNEATPGTLSVMSFGMWGLTEDGMPLRPTFYSGQLVSKFIRAGAELRRIDVTPDRALLAYLVANPDQSRAAYLLNPWDEPVSVSVDLSATPGQSVNRYQMDEPTVQSLIAAAELAIPSTTLAVPQSQVVPDTVPAEGMLVYHW